MLLFSTGAHGELEKDTEVDRSGYVHGNLTKNSPDLHNNEPPFSQNERKVRTSTRHTNNRGAKGKGKGKGYSTIPEEEQGGREEGSGGTECTNQRLVREEHHYYYECGDCGSDTTFADDDDYYDDSIRNTPTISPASPSGNGKAKGGKAGSKGKFSRKYSRK